ncbi:FkbM family methyltransferase [Antarcticirhabdus aurantiaca]|uniref:FkbM family methyltransferase n=1 Tax=Antarcticirhabdus aurantiaca TaxID=2606717 RepID=A0ACD4NPF4_9HYPH|nr:FkbM family methyltransferase [Antarcticirhabdus aurantiaca]WAJ28702.1 FkbM family methyltransferase [Jeongeuplla avenae]
MKFVSFAQNFEDVVLYRALAHVWNGTYVDVGAFDPKVDSVTKAFYDRGWSGINVEPVAEFHARFEADRPRDRNVLAALSDTAGEMTFHVVGETGLSTLDGEVARFHREAGRAVEERRVPVTTLNELLADIRDRPIHFLKIDVEGAEDKVLAGLDLDAIRPWILVIEATFPSRSEPTHMAWEDRVLSHRYELAYFDGLSRYYVAEERRELADRLAVPPNVFDEFETAYTVGLREALDASQTSYAGLLDQLTTERAAAERHAAELEAAHRETLERRETDAQAELEKHLSAAAREHERIHHALQGVQHQLAEIERSKAWRLVVFARRQMNRARRLAHRLLRPFRRPTRFGAAAGGIVPLGLELKYASKELARRIRLKALARR